MTFGSEAYGRAPYGGGQSYFQVVSTEAINPQTIVLTFSEDVVQDYQLVDPINYRIQKVGTPDFLSVEKVTVGPTPGTVRIFTEPQEYTLYHAVVSDLIESASGAILDPNANFSDFTGYPEVGSLRAQVVSSAKVVVIFGQEMEADASLTSITNYQIQDPQGALVGVSQVTTNKLVGPTQVSLALLSDLNPGVFYTLTVSSSIQSVTGLRVVPSSVKLTFNRLKREVKIPLNLFTGEVRENVPLLGSPDGLVFFSPSLVSGGSPNSSIQIDSVRNCTQAFDSYLIPQTSFSVPLYTFGGSGVTLLNQECLFTGFYPTREAQLNLTYQIEDDEPVTEDLLYDLTEDEPRPPTVTSILNSPGWVTFSGTMPPVGDFLPLDDHVSPAWVQFDASPGAVTYPFITLDNVGT